MKSCILCASPSPFLETWSCPLLGAEICSNCCKVELAGGMGTPDTLLSVSIKTRMNPQKIHEVCVGCPHGGKRLQSIPRVVSENASIGKAQRERAQEILLRLRWLRGEYPQGAVQRLNVQRGFKP